MFKINDPIDEMTAKNLNPISLAFLGDAVYSLYVRQELVQSYDLSSGKMNKLAVGKVNAVSQASLMRKIITNLTDDEVAVFKRARNAKKPAKAKSASVTDYNVSTGFEAVLGYLYLIGASDRIEFLLNIKGETNED